MENKYNQSYCKLSKGKKCDIINISYVVTISIPENIKMLGGDLRGKEKFDDFGMCFCPGHCRWLPVPFWNNGNYTTWTGWCGRLYRKRSGGKRKTEEAICTPQCTENGKPVAGQ